MTDLILPGDPDRLQQVADDLSEAMIVLVRFAEQKGGLKAAIWAEREVKRKMAGGLDMGLAIVEVHKELKK